MDGDEVHHPLVISDLFKSLKRRAWRTDGLSPTFLPAFRSVVVEIVRVETKHCQHFSGRFAWFLQLRLTMNSKIFDFRRAVLLSPPQLLALPTSEFLSASSTARLYYTGLELCCYWRD